VRRTRLLSGVVWITGWWRAPSSRERRYALVLVIRLRSLIGSVGRIPARSASATDQIAVAAALISEADRSVTLARPCHPLWRPGMHSTATSKITLCKSMRNLQAGHVPLAQEEVERTHFPPSSVENTGPASQPASCSGSPAAASISRTRAITRLVSSVILTAAARCSALSEGSIPRSCASARRAASGLLSWCWTRTIALRSSLRRAAGIGPAGTRFGAASPCLSAEDDCIDGSVTTDAARASTIVSI